PLSATTTSPSTPAVLIPVRALRMHVSSVPASLRQGMTTESSKGRDATRVSPAPRLACRLLARLLPSEDRADGGHDRADHPVRDVADHVAHRADGRAQAREVLGQAAQPVRPLLDRGAGAVQVLEGLPRLVQGLVETAACVL